MKPSLDQPLRAYWTYLPALLDGGFSRTSFRFWHPKRDQLGAENEAWSAKLRLGTDDRRYADAWVVRYRLPSRRGDPVEVLDSYQLDGYGHRKWGRSGGAKGWEERLYLPSRARAETSNGTR